MISTGRSNYPEILKKIWLPILDLLQNCRACRSWHAAHVCCLNLMSISYSFWNKKRKVLKFWKFDEKRAITPRRVIRFTSKCRACRSWHAAHVCCLNLMSISYSFWNKKWKVLKILKIWWKKGNNSKIGNQIFFKISG
jgi:ribosomal protein L32